MTTKADAQATTVKAAAAKTRQEVPAGVDRDVAAVALVLMESVSVVLIDSTSNGFDARP